MLEGPGSRARLDRLRRGFHSRGPRKRFLIRGKTIGLASFGFLIGAGSFVALDRFPVSSSSIAAPAFYQNCREAIQDGAAPIYHGQPGYAAHLDADNDGIACEPFRRR
ncbi:MAG: excalibur calcium-binding domain-containing protein [Burkholderiales bacterium]|nr:MAG: excalibur calcium-binding domain-containing protein [Burkholderiales bacterium]